MREECLTSDMKMLTQGKEGMDSRHQALGQWVQQKVLNVESYLW